MSEHVMLRDYEWRKLLCGKCGVPWPCQDKADEILAKIKLEAKKQ